MALATITKTVVTRNAATALPSYVTCATNEGAFITFDADDQKILLKIKNQITNATHTAVIVAGNGLQGTADVEFTLAASTEVVTVLESGKFVNVSGDNKGKVIVKDKSTTNTNAIAVAAIALP